MTAPKISKYFLPYQVEAITDESRLVLWEKSIRIGATFAMGFRAVRGRMLGRGNYLHTSVNAQIAKTFVKDCRKFCEIFDVVEKFGVKDIEESSTYNPLTDRQESAFEIYFERTKNSIKAFSSNPDALRGEGGDVGIDELTSHQQPEEMLKAAGGRAMWGGSIRIWTSHRGVDSCFNRMIQEERAKGERSRWKIMSTDLYQAIDQGLLDKINETKGTHFTREEFVNDTIAMVGGQEAFDEECLLKPRASGGNAIKWQWINLARQKYDLLRFDISDKDDAVLEQISTNVAAALAGSRGELGYDVARTGHLSVLFINKPEGNLRRLVGLVKIEKAKFGFQRALVERIMTKAPAIVAGGDKTGLGMQVCEELEDRFGQARFIGMNFGALKPELGTNLVRVFEDGRQILPLGMEHDDIAHDFAGIRTESLPSGRTHFFESSNPIEKRSHCDMAWAGALAHFAGKTSGGPKIFI